MRRKQCPRCRGEVRLDRDQYGWYEQCLMCGYIRDLRVLATPDKAAVSVRERGELEISEAA